MVLTTMTHCIFDATHRSVWSPYPLIISQNFEISKMVSKWPYWSIWWLQTRIRSKNYTQPSYSQISELTCLTNHDIGSRFYPLTTKNRRGRFLMSLIPMKPFEKDSSFILQSNRNFVFAAFDCLFLSIAKDRVVIGVIFFLFWSTFQSHEYYGLFRVWNFLSLFVPPDDFPRSRAS